jgi:hypothetical protein
MTLPSYDLELRAADERRRLHESVEELRCQLKDKLDVRNNAREHLGFACTVTAVLGLAAGYGVTSILFMR